MEIGAGFSLGRVAYNHDMRIGVLQSNIDKSRIKDDIVFIDNLKGKSIEQFIDEGMQKWIDEYNIGKKPCRQIKTTYTEWHKSQKMYQQGGKVEFAYEAVLSYGSRDNIGKMYQNAETREKIYNESKELFSKWIDDIKRDYPNLRIIYAVGHYSESTPHLHICFTPISTGYSRGLQTRISLSRSLENCGIEKITDTKEALEQGGFQLSRFFKKFRHEVMNRDLEQRGYNIKVEEHGKEHIDSKIYGEIASALENAKQLTESLKQAEELSLAPSYNPATVKRIQHKESIMGKSEELIAMPQETYEALKASADAQKLATETIQKIRKQETAIDKFMERIQSTSREERLLRENETLRARIREQELLIINEKQRQKEFKRKVLSFLRQNALIEYFKSFLQTIKLQERFNQIERETITEDISIERER